MKKFTAIAIVVIAVVLVNIVGGFVYFYIHNQPVYVESVDVKSNMLPTEDLILLNSSYAILTSEDGDFIKVTWSAYLSKSNNAFESDHIIFFFSANISANEYLVPMGEEHSMFTVVITTLTKNSQLGDCYPGGVIVKDHLKYGVRAQTFQMFTLWGCSDAYIKEVSNAQAAVSIPVYGHGTYTVSYQLSAYTLANGGVNLVTINFNAEATVPS